MASTIEWKATDDCGSVSGKILKLGTPSEINGIKVVLFKHSGKSVAVRYDTRPSLAKLVSEYEAEEEERTKKNTARFAEEKRKRDEIDAPLIDKMLSEAERLKKQIPSDGIPVQEVVTGDLDGEPIKTFSADGVVLGWRDITIIGQPCAVRPGAIGCFASTLVAYTTRDKINKAKEDEKKKLELKAIERAKPIKKSSVCKYCGTYCYGDCGGKPGDITEEERKRRLIQEEKFWEND